MNFKNKSRIGIFKTRNCCSHRNETFLFWFYLFKMFFFFHNPQGDSCEIKTMPSLVSSSIVLTNTVRTTPRMSITTWIMVELWAGSISSIFRKSGNTAPRQTLVKTIRANAKVTARVSANGVLNMMARRKPATERTALKAREILNS